MGYVLCKNPHVLRNAVPQAMIYKHGRMRLNDLTIRRFEIEDCKYIRAFFDKEKNVLALEPSINALEGSLKISKKNGIPIKFIFGYFGLDYKNYIGRYNVLKQAEHAFLLIDLDSKINNSAAGRKR